MAATTSGVFQGFYIYLLSPINLLVIELSTSTPPSTDDFQLMTLTGATASHEEIAEVEGKKTFDQ